MEAHTVCTTGEVIINLLRQVWVTSVLTTSCRHYPVRLLHSRGMGFIYEHLNCWTGFALPLLRIFIIYGSNDIEIVTAMAILPLYTFISQLKLNKLIFKLAEVILNKFGGEDVSLKLLFKVKLLNNKWLHC